MMLNVLSPYIYVCIWNGESGDTGMVSEKLEILKSYMARLQKLIFAKIVVQDVCPMEYIAVSVSKVFTT